MNTAPAWVVSVLFLDSYHALMTKPVVTPCIQALGGVDVVFHMFPEACTVLLHM